MQLLYLHYHDIVCVCSVNSRVCFLGLNIDTLGAHGFCNVSTKVTAVCEGLNGDSF